MRYITRQIDTPEDWDAQDDADRADVREFNRVLSPGMRLAVKDGGLTLSIHDVSIARLEKAAGALKCKSLGRSIIKSVKSIRSYGYSGGVRQYVDYNKERKVADRARKSRLRLAAKSSESPEPDGAMPGKYQNQVVCADSEEFLKKLPANSVDLIFTSPPYNFGLDYENRGTDADQWESYFDKLFSVFDECVRILRHGGRMIVNVQPLFSDYIPTHHVISHHLSKSLMWKGEILWEKNNYNCKYTAWGSWRSPSSPYLKYTWEFLEIFCKGSLKKQGDRSDADIGADDFKKWVYAKWSVAPERRMKEYGHPAMFPEELARRAIQLFSFRNDLVLDPFMGMGTTCKVAKALGRNYLGVDISDQYVKNARDRIAGIL